MRISVVTPRGELYSEEVDYVVVTSKMNGEFKMGEKMRHSGLGKKKGFQNGNLFFA